jgi:diguanylate cyclase (GGDEF)-like protein
MTSRRTRRWWALTVYTAVTIVAGVAAFVWSVQTYPLSEGISLTASGGREGILLGLIFWSLLGLLGGTRVERFGTYGALTFHLPFIVAAMALGGPTAGAVVALISTIERREIREMPWYGMLANHAALTVGAVLGGVVMLAVRDAMAGAVADGPQAVELISIVAASLVLAVVSTGAAVGTIVIRDELTVGEAVHLNDMAYRSTSASEVVLAWILAFTYAMIGWWAALISATLILVVWQAYEDHERTRHEPMTGLLSRSGFDARLAAAVEAANRRGRMAALLSIDLDGFKSINDRYGHATGDEVIAAVGDRLRASIRLTDAAVRRGGDEFGVLLVDMPSAATAEMLARRLHATLCEPIELDDREVSVGASIGLYLIRPSRRMPTIARLHDLADGLMYEAKRAGGGLRVPDPR